MNAPGSLLVVGADGLLGGTLVALARARGWAVHGTTLAAPDPAQPWLAQLDLNQPLGDWAPPPGTRSAVLAAAITSLDVCRRDPAGTRKINVGQTLELARRLVAAGVFVTFISSNLVFDGQRAAQPADAPFSPQTEYGRQKAEVEDSLRALPAHGATRAPTPPAHVGTAVVRLTKVLHARWPLVQGWIDRLRAGQPAEAFEDFVCAPIPLDQVVRGLADVAVNRRPGVWQFSADHDVSYADIARHLARRLGVDPALVRGVASRDKVALEHNPAHTTLDAGRATTELGLVFPPPLTTVEQAFLT